VREVALPLLTFIAVGLIGSVLTEGWPGALALVLVLLSATLIAGVVRHVIARADPAISVRRDSDVEISARILE